VQPAQADISVLHEGYAIAERATALRIVVERDNMSARDFYQRAGFVSVDTEIFERSLPAS
jgi:ribosomal protein S18 acetylase RimI-like enzyme